VEARVTDGRLRIEARREKAVPEGFSYRTEDRPLFLDAEVPLPPDASDATADATLSAGVLEVRIPKTGDGNRSIPVE
jgi:HSP20 family molecular chaperone IbpA